MSVSHGVSWPAFQPGSRPEALALHDEQGLGPAGDKATFVCCPASSRNYHLVPPAELEAPIQ